MMELVEAYRQRKYCEEIEDIRDKHQGTEGLLKALDTHIDNGIKTQSLGIRKAVFGSHEKPKP
jgi:hypothetical protein